jgi:hypothetical protein
MKRTKYISVKEHDQKYLELQQYFYWKLEKYFSDNIERGNAAKDCCKLCVREIINAIERQDSDTLADWKSLDQSLTSFANS